MYHEAIQARFHHLSDLQEYMALGHKKYLEYQRSVWNTYQLSTRRGQFEAWYYRDVIGTSNDQEDYIRSSGRVLLQCLTSPDLAPITLITTGRDFICSLCAHGKHCDNPDRIDQVAAITDRLETTIAQHKILGPFERRGDITNLSSFTIHSNMSVIRTILRVDIGLAKFIRD